MKRKFEVLKPQYMNEFTCIGAACSDTCCAGWRVDIDKRTYKNYKKIKDKNMSGKVNELVQRNKDSRNDDNYAFIQSSEGGCGFLNNGLCDIQLNFGEDYLSKTCLSYPRVFNIVDDRAELSAKLSCPEIARLALLNQNLMEFDLTEELFDARHSYRNSLKTSGSTWHSCFWDIRTFIIDLLQNRNYTISERMIMLGMFCEKLSSVSMVEDESTILNVVHEFRSKTDSDLTKAQLSELPRVVHVQVKLLIEMLQARKSTHERFNEYSEQTNTAFFIDTMDVKKVEESFTEGYDQYYKPFIDEHSYIFENYLVNHVFERLFLVRDNLNVQEDYILLVVLYSIIRFHIQGVATHNKQISVNDAVNIIQACSKVIEHSPLFLKSIIDHIKSSEFDLWALLIILVKE
ncbi:hypothetical protein GNP92_19620 [Paenibacillus timonensis]|nr:flagellin lysine-N-methylase [Paenibacillus timonensis]MUG88558.1 hypothetical protein [Paenibacillus timonensis]